VEEIFRALADPVRRRLLDRLNEHNGQTLVQLCSGLDMARQSVSKHLAVLEGAGLITSRRDGREKLHYLNAAPIHDIADRWISRYDRGRAAALSALKKTLEATTMTFVYETYIRTTPERLWQALTEPAFLEQYWGLHFDTDWEKGSTMVVVQGDIRISDPEQVVLEAEPFRRLAYTWHTFTPEWATANNVAEELRARYASEARSKVLFEIDDAGLDPGTVKLTVLHDGFDEGSQVLEGVRHGWPALMAKLKTLLETGSVLAI
jgi:uncharacterized protein YndB with AHSA1/START domain